jgi:hypothetical protein
MCAISSRFLAATATAGATTVRAVQIIDMEAGSVDRTVCTLDVRSAAVPPSREQQMLASMRFGSSAERTTFTANAQLHASPDGRTLYTLEHPAGGGSVLQAWDASRRDAIVPLAECRSAAVVTAMLVLQDGRIAYATVNGDVKVVAA